MEPLYLIDNDHDYITWDKIWFNVDANYTIRS